MGFDRFGTVSFVSQSKVDKFVDYLEEGKVMGTQCKSCGTKFFPPRNDCAQCLSSDIEWFEIAGSGKLLTFSKLMYAPSGFEKDLPYRICVVEYPDGVKVFGRISPAIPDEELAIGMELVAVPVKLSGDKVAYEFRRP
jgi:uncharacterized OB-fold protein